MGFIVSIGEGPLLLYMRDKCCTPACLLYPFNIISQNITGRILAFVDGSFLFIRNPGVKEIVEGQVHLDLTEAVYFIGSYSPCIAVIIKLILLTRCQLLPSLAVKIKPFQGCFQVLGTFIIFVLGLKILQFFFGRECCKSWPAAIIMISPGCRRIISAEGIIPPRVGPHRQFLNAAIVI